MNANVHLCFSMSISDERAMHLGEIVPTASHEQEASDLEAAFGFLVGIAAGALIWAVAVLSACTWLHFRM